MTRLALIMVDDLISTICPYCGVGCGINLKVNELGQLKSVEPQSNHPISQGKLCDKGWSTAYAVTNKNRLTQPLKRIKNEFFPISWDEALSTIAVELNQILDDSGCLLYTSDAADE